MPSTSPHVRKRFTWSMVGKIPDFCNSAVTSCLVRLLYPSSIFPIWSRHLVNSVFSIFPKCPLAYDITAALIRSEDSISIQRISSAATKCQLGRIIWVRRISPLYKASFTFSREEDLKRIPIAHLAISYSCAWIAPIQETNSFGDSNRGCSNCWLATRICVIIIYE